MIALFFLLKANCKLRTAIAAACINKWINGRMDDNCEKPIILNSLKVFVPSMYLSIWVCQLLFSSFLFFLAGKGREVISVVNYAKSIWFSEKTCLLPSHGWSCEVGYLTFLFYISDGGRTKWKKSVNGKAHCIMDEPWRIFFFWYESCKN